MTKRILTIALAVLGLAVMASPATAARRPHRYSPRHGAKCRKGYKRVRHHRRVYCVEKAKAAPKAAPVAPTTPPPAPPAPTTQQVKLHAHLDPTYTRNPLDPFQVTYAYSASATSQTFSATETPLTAEAPAPLPAGVLSFYSDGKLECAVNVGPGVEGSECPVTYKALGEHRVTTIYSSGEQSATETEVETITPLATTTTLSVSYAPVTLTEVGIGTGLYHIGDLTINVESSPAGKSTLGCGEGSAEHLTSSGCYEIEAIAEHVYGQETGSCTAPYLGPIWISKETDSSRIDGEAFTASELESGVYHLRASVGEGGGYSSSEATAPIKFKPEVTFPPDC